ncbi:MAG: hypothetical protein KY464_18600 [Gemmatimonadetes bacterium]|nr:hypothetical protein [Gemmatimonadota bacterium]
MSAIRTRRRPRRHTLSARIELDGKRVDLGRAKSRKEKHAIEAAALAWFGRRARPVTR